ncbi:hypothetical protein EYC84_003679 [Monilinia fructicola]|uniref:FAD-binding FR-type domain-containing protein n=1 Tax=Monilinia fructicola TaxID=38448 RepID=A0A5M9JX03_MONFR|nr:hypothetical protein EYC84_003679 [Monilinia fructicola]
MGESTKVPPSPSSRSITESQNSGGSSAMKVSVDPKQLEDVARQSATPILRFYRFITSEYRLLFTLVFCLNLGGVVGFLYEWATHGTPSKTAAALATSINLVVSILIREEHVVNLLYTIFASAPKSFPLWLRRRMGKIYHLGGLHSGCASAATFWFILLSIETSWRGPYHAEKNHSTHYNLYFGYSSHIHDPLALLWTLTVLTSDIERSPTQKLSKVLLVNPNMWLLAVATWSIIMTWLNCRKIKVQSEQLSTHALRIYFDYVTPSPGTTIRISSRPLFEWHAFATVADPKRDGFSLIISNAGDWTKKLINEPPKEIWARRTPTCGVLRIAPMFRSILLVATGSGIAPCLPVILAHKDPN